MKYKLLRSLSFFVTLSLLSACEPAPDPHWLLQGRTMGTTYNVKLVTPESALTQATLQQQIDEALIAVNDSMSTYQQDSELSRFNQSEKGALIAVSPALRKVLNESIRLHQLSAGVLDVTVGPLVNLWGFGPKARPEVVPDDNAIQQAREQVGIEHIQLTDEGLSKDIDDLYVDLSTIAKGYGVDVIAELLEQQNIHDYLIEIGGEMRIAGSKQDGAEWRVAIEKPESTTRSVQQIISVGDNGIATSGDYRNYHEENGVRYSHLIDPFTGKPITHNLVSVTVVHPSCMTADGMATAISVMGLEKGITFAEENNLAVMLISREKDGFKTYNSPEFAAYLR
ncbi:FAD:protein FMN transferase [Alteromonadaceae bacterium BrNp21-10]|nr:FAD:protein FMN transferase [Alteromonadaceae bacterium BrNp21-10]